MPTVEISYDTAIDAVEIAAITLTVFNSLAAGLVILFVILDNCHQQQSWFRIPWEGRMPISLAISVLVSNLIFIARESLELGSLDSAATGDNGTKESQKCIAANEASWLGTIYWSGHSTDISYLAPAACDSSESLLDGRIHNS
jgi:hypothetical protein